MMCDTMAIMPSWSQDGLSYFAKNSDRSPNEPLLTLRIPAMDHEQGSALRCTYIEIPQVAHTREIIVCRPSWMWGAEMGVNDARVAIGNEAVFTKAKRGEPALTGMDLLRLALERSDSAEAAVEIIIDLLQKHGQGGNCGFDKEFYYDNSFLISDPSSGYVLETAAKNYAVTAIVDRYAISNRLGIRTEHVEAEGVPPGGDFTRRFSEPVQSFFSQAKQRKCQVMDRLKPSSGARGLTEVLRTHAPGFDGHEFTRASVGSVCMHAGGMIGDQTTGSMVVTLRPDKPITLWMTGSSTPCVSAFKPLFWASDSPPLFNDPPPSLEYWLKREHLHRAIISGKVDVAALRKRIKKLESSWFDQEAQILDADHPREDELVAFSRYASQEEQALIDEFSVDSWRELDSKSRYAKYWQKKNEALGLERTL
ncbi:MAG: peptidase U34 [Actinomycetia bacterium]|nr:peptidase U34 [Actinomycetes bacterium]